MKKYLKIYFLSLSFFVLIGAIPIIFLYRSGEYLLLNNVVTKQRQSIRKIIYGAALFDQKHHYKRLLLEASSSRIVTLGSSRVMQFRQHMFLEEFINMGGAMGSINQGALIAPDRKSVV